MFKPGQLVQFTTLSYYDEEYDNAYHYDEFDLGTYYEVMAIKNYSNCFPVEFKNPEKDTGIELLYAPYEILKPAGIRKKKS